MEPLIESEDRYRTARQHRRREDLNDERRGYAAAMLPAMGIGGTSGYIMGAIIGYGAGLGPEALDPNTLTIGLGMLGAAAGIIPSALNIRSTNQKLDDIDTSIAGGLERKVSYPTDVKPSSVELDEQPYMKRSA